MSGLADIEKKFLALAPETQTAISPPLLASEDQILDRLAEALPGLGLVGEDRNAKIIYLAVTTRLLPRPVSVAIKGPSSGGKSFTIEQVLRLFPKDAYYELTGMSEKALIYSEEPLSHRMLVIYEAVALASDFLSYLIRTLLSEGRIAWDTVEKTKLKPVHIEKEGPTGLITTTTRIKLHPENETRLIAILADDTPEQTAGVLRRLAREDVPSPDVEPWIALQRWIATAAHDVTIPYADKLAELIPPVAVRLRRDFTTVLNLIRAHAILHQANRARDAQGWIVATVVDYAQVRELVADLVSEGVGATVSGTMRDRRGRSQAKGGKLRASDIRAAREGATPG
jgi:hypothetical protein